MSQTADPFALSDKPIEKVAEGASGVVGIGAAAISAKWNHPADFDLMCVTEMRDGRKAITYFGAKREGQLMNAPLFMEHSGDEGVGGTVKEEGNSETISISQIPADVKAHHFVFTDYDSIIGRNGCVAGQQGRFSQSPFHKIEIRDDAGNARECTTILKDNKANAIHMASIVNDPAGSARIVNTSQGHNFNAFTEAAISNIPFWAAPGMTQ